MNDKYYLVSKAKTSQYQKKYNQTEKRKTSERHRHHKKVDKLFNNCSLCREKGKK